MKQKTALAATLLLGFALALAVIVACGPKEEAVPRSYQCTVYTEQGCAKFVVASGGEIEIQSGGTFDLQAGATTDFSSGVDLDGGTLTMDADADTTMAASLDEVITVTLGAATGRLDVKTGNLKVGDGANNTALNGEDAYVEGTFEVDGAVRFDGAVDMNSTLDMSNQTISNVGAAGTDFDGNGGLTIASTGAITVEGTQFSGPITFGTDASTDDGELIAHSLGTTPTAVIVTPISATLNTNFVVALGSTNATSFTVQITPTVAGGNIGIYWMAGR